MSDIRFTIKRYLDEGRIVLPVKPGEKATRFPDWPNQIPTLNDFAANDNVAERLDTTVDVDCDSQLTRDAALKFLPNTDRMHGRPSAGTTHYFYVAADGEPKSEVFKDTEGAVLVEIRHGSSQYTLIPPSVLARKDDPSRTEVLQGQDGAPGRVAFDGLREAVACLATTALLAKNWPSGSRHDCAMAAAGFLISRELDPELIKLIITTAAELANDTEIKDRATAVKDSISTFQKGGKTTGLPKLGAFIGDEVVKRLRAWWGGESESIVDELNARHFMVQVGKHYKVADVQDDKVTFFEPEELRKHYANKRVQIGSKATKKNGSSSPIYKSKFDIWYESPRRAEFREVVFIPPGGKKIPHERDFNLWRPSPIVPASGTSKELAAQCSCFLQHVEHVICRGNAEHYHYLMDLLALLIQSPGDRWGVGVALLGDEGTGKGNFVHAVGQLVGATHYRQVDKADQIVGRFNAAISARTVIFADEAFFAGDPRHVATLKRLITEPTIEIERKGLDTVTEDNNVHLFMASNEPWFVRMTQHDRRLFVLDVSDEKRGDLVYGKKYWDQWEHGGASAALAYLQAWKIEDRMRLRKPINTPEAERQRRYSLAIGVRFLLEWMESPDFKAGAFYTNDDIYDRFAKWADDKHYEKERPSRESFGKLCRRIGGISTKDAQDRRGWRFERQRLADGWTEHKIAFYPWQEVEAVGLDL